MPVSSDCGIRVGWPGLLPGRVLNMSVRQRGVALLGAEVRGRWPEHSGGRSSHRHEGEGIMPTKTRSDSTSEASPGQSDKRDQLLRIYDELDDIRKQESLRISMELLRSK